MEQVFERLRAFNLRWKDLPRRGLTVAGTLLALLVLTRLAPMVAPFLAAALLAWALLRPARPLERLLARAKLPAKLADAVVVLLFYALVAILAYMLGARVVTEARDLLSAVPEMSGRATEIIDQLLQKGEVLIGAEALDGVKELLSSQVGKIASWAAGKAGELASWTWDTAMSLPTMILFTVLMVMGTFYMLADRARIAAFALRWTPDTVKAKAMSVKNTVFKALLGQIRAALIMLVITTVELCVGFSVVGMDYALVLGLFIALVDLLPVLGAGLFLIPMAIFGLVTGDMAVGVGCAAIYGITIVVRQIVEPRIVSSQLGTYPLATMIAMYAGLMTMGVIGMLAGPVLLMIMTAILSENAPEAEAPKARRRRFQPVRHDAKPSPSGGAGNTKERN